MDLFTAGWAAEMIAPRPKNKKGKAGSNEPAFLNQRIVRLKASLVTLTIIAATLYGSALDAGRRSSGDPSSHLLCLPGYELTHRGQTHRS